MANMPHLIIKLAMPARPRCALPLPNPPPEGEGANASLREFHSNGHGNCATPKNETRDAHFPLPNPPPEGEGANASLREFHSNDYFGGSALSLNNVNALSCGAGNILNSLNH
jgi:hypothetical protein